MTENLPEEQQQGMLVPDFMNDDASVGKEDVSKYFVPPRLKVVQPQSSTELRQIFNDGDVIISSTKDLIAPIELNERHKPMDEGELFGFTPVFFFVEYLKMNPYQLKSSLPMIADRSLDHSSELARKCRDPKTRAEEYDGPEGEEGKTYMYKNVEVLNFMGFIHKPEFKEILLVASFAGGSHKHGRNLATMISMRTKAPIFGNNFGLRTRVTTNDMNTWYCLTAEQPPLALCPPYVMEKESYEFYKAAHFKCKKLFEDQLIQTAYDDDEEVAEENTERSF